jgi:hypothetical protein
LLSDAQLKIAETELAVSSAGAGGAGGLAGDGGGGGTGGVGQCAGGDGGKGGRGGAGSGGAGGISVAVLYRGTAPVLDPATQEAIKVGEKGVRGEGGAPGVNDGPEGIAEKLKDVSQL